MKRIIQRPLLPLHSRPRRYPGARQYAFNPQVIPTRHGNLRVAPALGDSPLSIMSIGSMQDLGYSTNPAAAERYHVSGRQERVASDEPAAQRFDLAGRERLIRPLAVVE